MNKRNTDETKKTEDALLTNETQGSFAASCLSLINASMLLSKVDIHGTILDVNDEFCRIFGYSRQELIGKEYSFLKYSSNSNNFIADLWLTILSKKEFKAVFINKNSRGDAVYIKQTIKPMLDPKTCEIDHFISIGYEITNTMKSFELTQKAQNEYILFLNNISHEMRTPLNALVALFPLLKSCHENDARSTRMLEAMEEGIDNLNGLVENILLYQKINSDEEISQEDCDVSSLLFSSRKHPKNDYHETTVYI